MFQPLRTSRRQQCCAPLAYSVKRKKLGISLYIRINRTLAHSAQIRAGDACRIDIGSDSDAGTLRLTKVLQGRLHWHARSTTASALCIHCAWSPELEPLFPEIATISPLTVIDVTRDAGITFSVPPLPTVKSGAAEKTAP